MTEDWDALESALRATPLLDSLRERMGDEAFEDVVGHAVGAATREALTTRTQLSEEVFAEALRERYEAVWVGPLSPEMARLVAREAIPRSRVEIGRRIMEARAEEERDER